MVYIRNTGYVLGLEKRCEIWRCVFEGKAVNFESKAGCFRIGNRDTGPESECRLDMCKRFVRRNLTNWSGVLDFVYLG